MPPLELFGFAASILVAGAFAGLIAGLFGVGGGVIVVPVLFSIFSLAHVPLDTAIHMAIGTSLITIIPTSIASFRAHARHGAVDKTILRHWRIAVVVGATLGAVTANHLSGATLSLIFGIFMAVIAVATGFAPQNLRLAEQLPGGIVQKAIAGFIGFISAVVGVGGGSLSVPTLLLYNVPIHRAIGTASMIGLLISLPATIVFMLSPPLATVLPPGSLGHVNLLAFALLAPATMLMAPKGARLSHRLPAAKLRRIFSVFLLVMAAKMIFGAVG